MEVLLVKCGDYAFEYVKEIRYSVFTLEQNIAQSDDLDSYDASPDTVYALVEDGGEYVACGRLILTPYGYKIGRVATLKKYRGRQYGSALVKALCEKARELGAGFVNLEAQLHAVPFYERLGFEIISDEAVYDRNIEHRKMRLTYGEKE
ncbi:MAG: GNAT family N-acetyltransferase [Eubacterium sp.]|nr:GNAT family N-acetyltransferase [Eubacterium sp.]